LRKNNRITGIVLLAGQNEDQAHQHCCYRINRRESSQNHLFLRSTITLQLLQNPGLPSSPIVVYKRRPMRRNLMMDDEKQTGTPK
jgi:hypothetical protein